MTEYVVLLIGDEAVWADADEKTRAEIFARHEEFSRLLEERGHTITGGAELTHSQATKQVRRAADGSVTITDGPYTESVEQLGGFYSVRSDDLDDLLQICAVLADGDGAVEVRPAVEHSETS